MQEGWPAVTADFSGQTLVWAESKTFNLPGDPSLGLSGFPYWAAEAYSATLRGGTFTSAAARRIAVRNQIGPSDRTAISGGGVGGAGRFTLVAGGRRFAPPVVWCCTPDTRRVEVVVESDGRAGGATTLAATTDGRRVRYLVRQAEAVRLVSIDPALLEQSPAAALLDRTETPFPSPGVGLVAMAPGIVAWVDSAAPAGGAQSVRVALIGRTGLSETAPLLQPGQVVRIWATRAVLAVAVRVGGRIEVARHEVASGRRSVIWRGARVPPVAIGGGAVTVADGRRVMGARGARMRLLRTATGTVAALATDGRRVASFERITIRPRRGPALRRTAVRLAAIG